MTCPKCGGHLRMLSFIENPSVIERILHLKLCNPPESPHPPGVQQGWNRILIFSTGRLQPGSLSASIDAATRRIISRRQSESGFSETGDNSLFSHGAIFLSACTMAKIGSCPRMGGCLSPIVYADLQTEPAPEGVDDRRKGYSARPQADPGAVAHRPAHDVADRRAGCEVARPVPVLSRA